ncbi:hypothetical protein K0M31_010842 [Melipona bicolor]|uniref:Uncharacterized protein n=1 Tax=Melipona bicolor TaxID=60889 RepID=A0AA40FLE2_9HYME|nr:hypothetical protein K0M31_010842 [Melipona bicolor]
MPPSADSWLRDSKSWHRSSTENSNSVGSPGTRFSYAGVAPTRLQHMRRNHARMGWLATPQVPRRHSAAGGGAP